MPSTNDVISDDSRLCESTQMNDQNCQSENEAVRNNTTTEDNSNSNNSMEIDQDVNEEIPPDHTMVIADFNERPMEEDINDTLRESQQVVFQISFSTEVKYYFYKL